LVVILVVLPFGPNLPLRTKDSSPRSLKINSPLSSRIMSKITCDTTSPRIAPDDQVDITSQKSLGFSQPLNTAILTSHDIDVKPLTSDRQLDISTEAASLGSEEFKRLCSQTITCQCCGGCRCDECAERRKLPRGFRRTVDVVSCVCCVQTVFYHCRGCSEQGVEYEAGEDPSDRPCSCTGQPVHGCCRRWTCMVAAGLSCLPCLLLYWPLRLMLALTERCYDTCSSVGQSPRGCQCRLDRGRDEGVKGGRKSPPSFCEVSSGGWTASTSSGHVLLIESQSSTTSESITRKFELV